MNETGCSRSAADSRLILLCRLTAALTRILRIGKADGERSGSGFNAYAEEMQQCGGAASVHALQQHEDEKMREFANFIVELYLR